ncbi:J domain-containing protein [Actinospongicola halichondriae]|uniref:J domain-containing protein n=1 Tax=Actinospongicola halichondriae TaxID=3236844 RepID=UPI003D449AF1
MQLVEHYEELGVAPNATTAEIRVSYLTLARRFHPDGLATAGEEDRATASARMARINAAWTVLGDDGRRARYDAALDLPSRSSATVRDAGATWTPYEDDDGLDPRLVDDTPTGTPSMRRGLTFLPSVLVVAALATLVVGFTIGLGPMLGVGVILLVCGALSFLVVPLVALAKSSRADRL